MNQNDSSKRIRKRKNEQITKLFSSPSLKNMGGLINKVDMVCLSPVGYGVSLTFRALALR